MDSAINYYNYDNPHLPYTAGQLFLDNGAYTAASQNLNLEVDRIVAVQEAIWPNKTIPLDYPLRPGMGLSAIKKNWGNTKRNIMYWQENTRLSKRLVAPLHAWDKESLKRNIGWLQKYADTDLLAVGSLVNYNEFGGYFGDRQPRRETIDLLTLAVQTINKESDFKVHLMGFGASPLTLHLAYYMGAYSTDSSGYRRKAAYGKIVLPGSGERYAGNSSATFGLTMYTHRDLDLLSECRCQICRANPDVLWSSWRARAAHNEFVMKLEAARADALLAQGRDAYALYLEDVFSRSSLRYLWKHTKERVRYHRISEYLVGR
jgi:hypothetical protein